MEDCKPCPFGYTSRAGAYTAEECQRITQPCPVGQIAPPDAVSAQQCGCLPGYGGAGSLQVERGFAGAGLAFRAIGSVPQ